MFKLCGTIWNQKETALEKGYIQKKVVKVEEYEVDGDEESKKNWKDCNVKALVILCGEMEHKFVTDAKKKG